MFEPAKGLKDKDATAIAWLYERYGKKLNGYALTKWKLAEDDSWDLVYKTLYKVIQVVDQYTFEDEGKFTAFVFKIFINYLRNHYRDTKAKGIVTTELLEMHEKISSDRKESEEGQQQLSPLMKCLQKALQLLDDWQRMLLLMRAQNHSYDDIAGYVQKPGDQLKVYHMRLKKVVAKNTTECMNKKE